MVSDGSMHCFHYYLSSIAYLPLLLFSMHPHGVGNAMGPQQVHASQVYNNVSAGNQHDF